MIYFQHFPLKHFMKSPMYPYNYYYFSINNIKQEREENNNHSQYPTYCKDE